MTASVCGSVCLCLGLRRWFWEGARVREYRINYSSVADELTCIWVSPMVTSSSCLHVRLLLSVYTWERVSIRGTAGSGTSSSIHDSPWDLCGLVQNPYLPSPWLYTLYKPHGLSVIMLMGSGCSPRGRRRHRNILVFSSLEQQPLPQSIRGPGDPRSSPPGDLQEGRATCHPTIGTTDSLYSRT